MLVHFPIVFFLSLAVFDLIASLRGVIVTGRSVAGTISAALALLAGLSAAAAYTFGAVALDLAEAGGFHSDIAEIHEGLGGVTALALIVWAAIRGLAYWRDIRIAGKLTAGIIAFEVAGVALITTTAFYGGKLVFDLGVNVSRIVGAT
jgi:uncharacterized membrane protein